jgi:hypothetical protein
MKLEENEVMVAASSGMTPKSNDVVKLPQV